MHEASLMRDLFRKIDDVSREHDGARVMSLTVRLGALSHFTTAHFREHFEIASPGTSAAGATVEVVLCDDMTAPHAQSVLLESLELAGS